ncbi:hypothetical protein C8J42_104219 [Sphingomonas sp. PP-CE-1A-559]|uniref:hypothetical protein n=1 Tax=Sphingomonas sp. PP-CE-1A-559 TaxID=2135657 RepID=UPI0010542046|nr:hypothetical protein [Sphingomonas sp. PP-CE-1A-559]TCP89991.1 hypothetical protein C8J42_104219 [Sphingomonas sp. PP-CE-1A-559]
MFSLRHRSGQAILLLLVAFALRSPFFGNPVIHSDEQFYLLVGDRLLHGAWPFVDIFDRKPVGLFLIFAGIRSVGGDGVLMYQLAATLVAAATAFLVARIVSRLSSNDANPVASVGAALIYLVWIIVFDGAGGQSAIWGNALMAAAALLVLDTTRGHRHISLRGAGAMLLIGLAMQIKYTAMFEGIFFGLTLVWAAYRDGRSIGRLMADAALWIGAALFPTALAWAVYAAAGRGDAFVFANFLSIFGQQDDDTLSSNLLKLLGGVGMSLPLAWLAWRGRRAGSFALGWLAAAVIAILIMHTFELLYLLPLALPLSVAAGTGLSGPTVRTTMVRLAAVLVFGALAATIMTSVRIGRRGNARQIAQLVQMIGQQPRGCMFAYGSEPILYFLTRSCLPTPYIFRSHLGQTAESHGTGVDPVVEVARLLAARPGVIVVRAPKPTTNLATQALVLRAIATRYRLVGSVKIGGLPQSVYRLRTDAPR